MGRRAALLGAATVSAVMLLGVGQARGAFDMEKALAPRIFGDPNAPIHVAEYFSLSCGHCANFHKDKFPRLKAEWIDTGRARFEYRDFPFDGLTLYAHALARAVPAEAYEGMLDALFNKQKQWTTSEDPVSDLAEIAKLAGIGKDAFTAILENRPYLEGVVAIRQTGIDNWNINSTPTFVVNGKDIIRGNVDYGEFLEVLGKHAA